MDRHLKERLVGAAVLVATAIIFIPEMLSGPRDPALVKDESVGKSTDSSGVKTFTIDLNSAKPTDADRAQEGARETRTQVAELPAPPSPESSVAMANPSRDTNGDAAHPAGMEKKPESVPERATVERSIVDKTVPDKAGADRALAKAAEAPAERTSEAPRPSDKAVVAKPTPSDAQGGWAVQVASFGARATSDRIAGELKAKGFPAYVTSFVANNQTMYRVRVGPVADRAAAEALLKKIKPLHASAAVVTQ